MMGQLQTLRVDDGRRFGYSTFGNPRGRPVLMLHGTPGSRLMFTVTDAPATALGLNVIALDRWGYGGSDAHPAPTLAGFAADVGQIMTALGHPRFAIAGVSGGGPYAAAVAAEMGDRITAAALISPVGLIADSIAAGEIGAFHRFCFITLAARPTAVAAIFNVYRWATMKVPAIACALATLRAPAADKLMIADPGVADRLMQSFAEGLRAGTRGPAIDLALFK